ncbi:hydrogenase small subunit [Desulforhabdus amnigena]|uniref:Periplasmic [NiFe] hydrogenase small subunit 1 n=1 Tax=Desulforhabdus amnigena TaxID=40218 RepID=A0A9W6FVT8_9BACT|nr:hydrogenase small subunit [Desulforhabdus amnigena]NLJ27036.1 hydrogenase small subunit [Deltaproteobacteria bacterium]GLI35784.1 periplasmic [NiFe] hydrogenase small subunit 1 [Desulforhabdus amnigena]
MKREKGFEERLEKRGVSRRDFMKYCTLLSATMGLSSSFVPRIAEAFTSAKRPPVVWLSFAECTGCAEATLRTTYPWIDELLLDIISLDYQETLMAPSGEAAEKSLHDTIAKNEGKFICVVDGSIPTAENGVYGMIGGKTFLEIAKEVCPKALATICIGTCASYGGIPAAAPNPTGAKSVKDAIGVSTLNIPGCPPNPINFVGTIVNYLLFGKLPDLDDKGRPLFAYGKTIHDQCPRRSHFENGEFVTSFDSEEARLGYCLYQVGCKGPETYNNCPAVKFNEGTSWPVQAGHPCIGCSEPDFWDKLSPFYKSL